MAKFICKKLVKDESNVFVSFYYTRNKGVITITSIKDELKRIVGKYGKNIKSLKIILNAMAAKQGVQIEIKTKNI